jgi:tRNA-specific 2-thiouridylase
MARIFVGMSGGVDSSTAAALLVRDGHDVVGVTLALLPEQVAAENWADATVEAAGPDASEGCCDASGARRARAVCDTLGIPHYTWNAREAFAEDVVRPFARAYGAGLTPNPCIECNDRIKFTWMLSRALASGADALATGHYARILEAVPEGFRIARAVDHTKDQSYFLYRCTAEQLGSMAFPLGALTKRKVRELAAEFGLPTAATPESQETCFAPDGDYSAIVAAECPGALEPGEIVDLRGRVLGTHQGVARFTIGQRKGLSLSGGPWFVVRLEPETRRVIVGERTELEVTKVVAEDVVWNGLEEPTEAFVALRYRMDPVHATVTPRFHAGHAEPGTHMAPANDELAHVTALDITLHEPVSGVAPGQAAVVYAGEIVLGGGVVSEAR